VKKILDPRGNFEGFTLIGSVAADAEDFSAYLTVLRAELSTPEEPERLTLLEVALNDCEAAVHTDADAELLRKGVRLAACLADFERRRYFRGVLKTNLRKGRITRDHNRALKYDEIATAYKAREPIDGDVKARHYLEEQFERSAPHIKTVLNIVGVQWKTREPE